MRITLNLTAPIVCLALATWLGLAGCSTAKEDLATGKRAENEAQIKQYLATNGLTARDTLGLFFVLTKPNPDGQPARPGDSVTVHHVTSTLEGRKIDSTSVRNNRPFSFLLRFDRRVLRGFDAGVGLMREGEKATVLVPSDLAFRGLGDPNYFPAYAPLRFDLEVVDVIDENEQINKYLAANDPAEFRATGSGLRFKRTQARPDSALVETGKTASVRYTGRLLNGTQFDSNSTAATLYEVTIGSSNAVKGFEEGIALMRKGERATLVFPSALGYGEKGSGSIYPYAPLVFDVEVISIR